MAESIGEQSVPDIEKRQHRLTYDSEEFTLRKRLPKSFPTRDIDIYVSKKTNFMLQLERCKKLLNGGEEELVIHGLGAAVNRAINLSLQLKAVYGDTVEISSHTSTEVMVDDLEPLIDTLEPKSVSRNIPAIHIRVVSSGKKLPEEPVCIEEAEIEEIEPPEKRQRIGIEVEKPAQVIIPAAEGRHFQTLQVIPQVIRNFHHDGREERQYQLVTSADSVTSVTAADLRHFQNIQIITSPEGREYHAIQTTTDQGTSYPTVTIASKLITVEEPEAAQEPLQIIQQVDDKATLLERRGRLTYDTEEHGFRQRLPKKYPRSENDIYVTQKTNFKIQFDRCKQLLDFGSSEVVIHGFGPGLNRAIYLSLQLKAYYGENVDMTSGSALPESNADDGSKESEVDSPIGPNDQAVHIRVFKKDVVQTVTLEVVDQ